MFPTNGTGSISILLLSYTLHGADTFTRQEDIGPSSLAVERSKGFEFPLM
jgi:hypothetical protein